MESPRRLLWQTPEWLEQVHAWIERELGRLGATVTGVAEQPHAMPWATALRVPTDRGVVWFKANVPGLAHEAGAIAVLARVAPERVPRLLAVDAGTGWMLQADAGTRLREAVGPARWERILPLYAELQLEAAPLHAELLDAGVPDRALASLPAAYAALLADEAVAGTDVAEPLEPTQLARLRYLEPAVAGACEELAALGLRETIEHDDFHDANVFVDRGSYRFLDWADACVSHPFFTLVVTLRGQLGLQEGTPELDRLRDAYLEPWTALRPRAELLLAFPHVWTLGSICRALQWHAIAQSLPPPFDVEYAAGCRGWLGRFLDAWNETRGGRQAAPR